MLSCNKEPNPDNHVVKTTDPTDHSITPDSPPKAGFKKILILGNSITHTSPNPSIGWYGDWGMAATVQDSDYVHILERNFKLQNDSAKVETVNILPFEVDCEHYDLTQLQKYRDAKPDFIIIRIGENVPGKIDLNLFERRYTALVNYLKTDNPDVLILGGGSIWGSIVDNVMANHPPFISLKAIVQDPSNFSYGLFADPGIQAHPCNKGMRNMAAILWDAVIKITP